MSAEPRPSRRFDDDLRFTTTGGPPKYNHLTDKPVLYVTVANQRSGVIGYLWACDADDAAGWEARPAAGDDAYNGSLPWLMMLRRAKARSIAPSMALREMSLVPGEEPTGRVVPGSLTQAPSLTALKELAAQS